MENNILFLDSAIVKAFMLVISLYIFDHIHVSVIKSTYGLAQSN